MKKKTRKPKPCIFQAVLHNGVPLITAKTRLRCKKQAAKLYKEVDPQNKFKLTPLKIVKVRVD